MPAGEGRNTGPAGRQTKYKCPTGRFYRIFLQKQMLEEFARRNGLPNPTHFTDDGVSGTRFDRPGFLAMMEEVEAGRVEAIVIKDLSRFGRDYLTVGQYTDIIFPSYDVRFIAVNDGVDSERGDSDGFAAIRNLFNDNLE